MKDKKKSLNNNSKNTGSFPPRGSFIQIPQEVLSNSSETDLDNIIKDKKNNIKSDLYK